jgi:hypothetical protein
LEAPSYRSCFIKAGAGDSAFSLCSYLSKESIASIPELLDETELCRFYSSSGNRSRRPEYGTFDWSLYVLCLTVVAADERGFKEMKVDRSSSRLGRHTSMRSIGTSLAAELGTWSLIDTSHVLSCAYDLTAVASGGRGDDTVKWAGATITLAAPPALPATQENPAARVAGWFNRPLVSTGSPATARMNIGRDRPFTAEHQFRYRLPGDMTSTAVATVQCRAP